MVVETDVQLGKNGSRQSGVTDHDNRLQSVSQATQVLFLWFT
jgi:hypothetical protein